MKRSDEEKALREHCREVGYTKKQMRAYVEGTLKRLGITPYRKRKNK